jgi:hypothetical protein
MNSKQPKPKNTAPEQSEKQSVIKPNAITKKAVKKSSAAKPINTQEAESAIGISENEAQPSAKKKKNGKEKVIRDSFSFPEHDYLKISELKQTCLAEGIHVKKGELLRAGLQLLSKLSSAELKQAVEQVEKVKTGRPNASKNNGRV